MTSDVTSGSTDLDRPATLVVDVAGLAVALTLGGEDPVARVRAAGARPVAVLDALRLGPADDAATGPAAGAAVASVAASGLPVVGGEVRFGDGHDGGPQLDVLCVGVVDSRAGAGPGDGANGCPGGDVDGPGASASGAADPLSRNASGGPTGLTAADLDAGPHPDAITWPDSRQSDTPDALPRPASGDELRAAVLRLAASSNLCSRAWITDRLAAAPGDAQDGVVELGPGDDAGVVRLDPATGAGVALALDSDGRFGALDPYLGARLAVAEAYRNVVTTGARPVAAVHHVHTGHAERPAAHWHLERVLAGIADTCRELGLAVSGGGVTVHEPGAAPSRPRPVVGVLGAFDDVARRTPSGWRDPGHVIYQLGVTREELAGSEWAWVEHAHLGGRPPTVDPAAERLLGDLLVNASRDGLVDGAHDLSAGGLAQALVESCLRFGVGARVWLDGVCDRDGVSPFVALFAESTARAVAVVPRSEEIRFTDMCTARGYPVARIGVVDDAGGPDGAQVLEVQGLFTVGLDELAAAHRGPFSPR